MDMSKVSEEIAVIENEANEVLVKARGFRVNNQDDYDKASAFIKGVKGLQKKVEDTFKPIVKKAHAVWKEAKEQEKKHFEPLKEAERIVKAAALVWWEAEEAKRQEDERKAREKAAEAERKRIAELEAQAANHEEKGRFDKAEERRQAAQEVYVPPEPVVSGPEKAQGQAIRVTWKAEVTDLKALVRAVAEGRAPSSFIQADLVAINKQARATQDTMKIDGIRFYSKKEMAVR